MLLQPLSRIDVIDGDDEGPFVFFAGLLFGIIFLFFILIVALLINQKRISQAPPQNVAALINTRAVLRDQAKRLEAQIFQLNAKLAQAVQLAHKTPPADPIPPYPVPWQQSAVEKSLRGKLMPSNLKTARRQRN